MAPQHQCNPRHKPASTKAAQPGSLKNDRARSAMHMVARFDSKQTQKKWLDDLTVKIKDENSANKNLKKEICDLKATMSKVYSYLG